MQNIKKYFMTLALLIMAVGGAWAGEEPQLLTTINASSSFLTGSQTFDDKVTVTFSNPVYYDGEEGWYAGSPSLLTVAGTNGYTITSCKFYTGYGTAQTGYTVEGESPSVCLSGGFVFTDANQSVTMGYEGVTKIEVYGAAEPTEWSLTPDADKMVWTLDKMPASNVELQVEYYAESNLFLGKEALADKANIAVKNGETAVAFDDDGKSTTTVTEGNTVTAKFTGKKVLGMKVAKKPESLIVNPVVGQIIGSDGKNYDANATLPDGVKAVAMIAYVGNDAETSTTYNHGLALALENVSGAKVWCSQTSVTCLGTQYVNLTKFNDLAGIANTDALVNNTGHIHDAASAARGYNSGIHPDGTSAWFLPSAGQWYKMVTAAGDYATLKTNAGLQSSSYWSSTESGADKAWRFSFSNGGWNNASKVSALYVRACLAF